MFGLGRPRALDRNAKARIMHWARCLSLQDGEAPEGAGGARGTLSWAFHNARSGGSASRPMRRLAEVAGRARSTVTHAIRAPGYVVSLAHRSRGSSGCASAAATFWATTGWRWRVLRTSNAYNFRDPGAS